MLDDLKAKKRQGLQPRLRSNSGEGAPGMRSRCSRHYAKAGDNAELKDWAGKRFPI